VINNLKLILDKKFYYFIFLIFGMVISSVIELFSITLVPVFISSLIDFESFLNFLPNKIYIFIEEFNETKVIIFSAIFIIFAFLIKSVIVFFVIYFELKLFRDIYLTLSNNLFHKYVIEPYSEHIKRNKSEIIRNLNEEVLNTSNYVRAVLIIARELSVMIGALIVILIISGIYASPGILIILAVSLTFILSIKKKLKNFGEKSIVIREEILNLINYGILSFKVGKILNLSSLLIKKFKNKNKTNQNYLFFQRLVSALPRFIIEFLAVIILLSICILFTILDYSNAETISLLALISLITIRMIPAFQQITGAFTATKFYKPSFNLISKEIISIQNNIESKILDDDRLKFEKNKTFNKIIINNLSFKYEGQKNFIFKNLSIDLELNKIIGIYGKSGSGKTTFADILMCLLHSYDGNIYYGDLDIQNHADTWRNYISYVPQETFLINDSIKNNITFEKDTNDITNYKEAIDISMTSEFITKLPKKEDTMIGKFGFNLSGGQKQRVGIARALFKKPKFLIMDESTNSLDISAQSFVIKKLKEKRNVMTTVLISHDFNVIKECDQILHFINNKVIHYKNPKSFFEEQGI
tara:strand:+ start:11633 stop:13387 length:1755 start_codon:yes stop_codon:yes gene_type:complete